MSLLPSLSFRLTKLWQDLPRTIRTVATNAADPTRLSDRGRNAVSCHVDLLRQNKRNPKPVVGEVLRFGVKHD